MEGLLNFLADNYIWFAGISVFFAFALIGLVYETKKAKNVAKKTADAVTQPTNEAATPEQPGVVVASSAPAEPVVAGAPSLEGLESNTDSFAGTAVSNFSAPAAPETPVATPSVEPTLVIDDGTQTAPSAEPTLVIDDPATAPTAEPSLVIENPAVQAQVAPAVEQPAAPVAEPVAPAAPEQTQTLGAPGQPPM